MSVQDIEIFKSILRLVEDFKHPENRLYLGFSLRLRQGTSDSAAELFSEFGDPDFEMGIHPSSDYSGPTRPLSLAAALGLPKVVNHLLARGGDPNFSDSGMQLLGPLHMASFNGDPETVSTLLDSGADVGASNHNGTTPLIAAMRAVETDDARIRACSLLMDAGSDIEARDCFGYTCLMRAADDGCAWAVDLLLDRGANVNASARDDSTALILSRQGYHPSSEVEKILKSHFAAESPENELLFLCRGLVSSMADLSRAKQVISICRNVNCVSPHDGLTPLMAAAANRHNAGLVRLLLENGADPGVKGNRDSGGRNALETAVLNGAEETCEILKDHAKKNGSQSDERGSGLLLAVMRGAGADEIMELIKAGASTAARDLGGRTPLHLAAGRADLPVLELLIAAGAEIDARDEGGETPLMKAARKPGSIFSNVPLTTAKIYLESARKLLQAGADRGVRNKEGFTALELSHWSKMIDLLT